MADGVTDEDLHVLLQKVRKYGGITALADLACLSERTVYRYAGPSPDHDMNGDTRLALLDEMEKDGLLDATDERGVRAAVRSMKERAKAAASGAEAAALAEGQIPGPGGRAPKRRKRGGGGRGG
jgi:hypothetical protein